MNGVDWQRLLDVAGQAADAAYCPYSGYPVGAAGITVDGRTVSGCNVENAAFGVTLCAECGMISDLIKGGGGKLAAFVCVDRHRSELKPCGRCRQLLAEHAAEEFVARTAAGVTGIDGLLPDAFGVTDLREKHGREGMHARGRETS